MDGWLTLVRDYEELEKGKKAKAAGAIGKGQKRPAAMLRKRINQVIRERRAAEREDSYGSAGASDSPITGSPQSSEMSQPAPATIAHKDRFSDNHPVKGDKAFASHRRTVDRVLESLSAGDEAMIMQIKVLERDKMDRWEAVERDKLDVLCRALGARTGGASEAVERLAVQVEALEAQVKEMQGAIADQGQRIEEKLDMLMAMLQRPRL